MLSQKQREATPSYSIMSGSYAFSQAEEDKTLPLYSKHDPNMYGGGIWYMVVAWLSQWSIGIGVQLSAQSV